VKREVGKNENGVQESKSEVYDVSCLVFLFYNKRALNSESGPLIRPQNSTVKEMVTTTQEDCEKTATTSAPDEPLEKVKREEEEKP
jgi:hypothetical protein